MHVLTKDGKDIYIPVNHSFIPYYRYEPYSHWPILYIWPL